MFNLPLLSKMGESELHILIEVVKAIVALIIFIIVMKKRKKRQKAIDKYMEDSKKE